MASLPPRYRREPGHQAKWLWRTFREAVFAAVMADRADWERATRQQRHLAVAADAELRRRNPGPPIQPSTRRLERVTGYDLDMEAADRRPPGTLWKLER
jgi:hypothetical protein